MPRRLLLVVGRAVGALAWYAWPAGRSRAKKALDDANRHVGYQLVSTPKNVFVNLGELLADTLLLLRKNERAEQGALRFTERSKRVLAEALEQKRGVIFVTAHLGPWERMAALMAEEGFPITTIARESYDPRLTALYERWRAPRAVKSIYRGSPTFNQEVAESLKKGNVLGVLVDFAGRVRTTPVPWFGGCREFPSGVANLALRTGAVVVVGSPSRGTSGQFELVIETINTSDFVDKHDGAEQLNLLLAQHIEARVTHLPEHWPWMG